MLQRPPSTFLKKKELPTLLDSSGGGTMGTSSSGSEIFAGQSFFAPLQDKGSGEVSLIANGAGASQAPTFTRATTATTVLSTGLIGSVATGVPRSYYDPSTFTTNLCLQSEDLATTWTNINSTESVNSLASPDGNDTADTLIEDATAGVTHAVQQSISFTTGLPYTLSCFAKAKERTWCALAFPSAAFGVTTRAFFDLANGVVGTISGGAATSTIEVYPNGWYRCTVTMTSTATAAGTPAVRLATGDTVDTYNGDGASGAYFWGAQLEYASIAGPYVSTTTAIRSDFGLYSGYLAEDARTNLCLQSETLDNASWTLNSVTITANAVASSDGTTTADKIVEVAASAEHFANQPAIAVGASQPIVVSAFLKAAERRFAYLAAVDRDAASVRGAHFNLSTGSIVSTDATVTSTIKAYPNGWYRCTISYTLSAGATNPAVRVQVTADGATKVYLGVADSGIYAWGVMAENAAFASTYIPTTTAAVTRNADVLTYPFAGNADATVGTAYAELSTEWKAAVAIAMAFASGQFPLLVAGGASTTMVANDGTNVVNKTGLTDMSTASRKRISSWGSNLRVTGDGLAPEGGAFDGSFGSTNISIGSNADAGQQWFGTFKNVRIWNKQLSDYTLQRLTV